MKSTSIIEYFDTLEKQSVCFICGKLLFFASKPGGSNCSKTCYSHLSKKDERTIFFFKEFDVVIKFDKNGMATKIAENIRKRSDGLYPILKEHVLDINYPFDIMACVDLYDDKAITELIKNIGLLE